MVPIVVHQVNDLPAKSQMILNKKTGLNIFPPIIIIRRHFYRSTPNLPQMVFFFYAKLGTMKQNWAKFSKFKWIFFTYCWEKNNNNMNIIPLEVLLTRLGLLYCHHCCHLISYRKCFISLDWVWITDVWVFYA